MHRLWIAAGLLAMSFAAWSHGGGLDKQGCHHDRKNGGYHCHRGAARASATRDSGQRNGDALQRGGSSTAVFSNCAEARAAGAAPVRRGDPGYSRRLDRDGDGIGCE